MKHEPNIRADKAAELALAVRCLPAGARFIYHTGFLAVDAEKSPEAAAIRKAAWKLYEGGRVNLIQKRHSPGVYDYIAIMQGKGKAR